MAHACAAHLCHAHVHYVAHRGTTGRNTLWMNIKYREAAKETNAPQSATTQRPYNGHSRRLSQCSTQGCRPPLSFVSRVVGVLGDRGGEGKLAKANATAPTMQPKSMGLVPHKLIQSRSTQANVACSALPKLHKVPPCHCQARVCKCTSWIPRLPLGISFSFLFQQRARRLISHPCQQSYGNQLEESWDAMQL